MTSANEIVKDGFAIPNIVGMEQTVNAVQGQEGLRLLNQILGQWSLMPLTIPVTAREVFPLTAGRGGPSDPYTIGPGGDFDTSRPTSITNVGLYDTDSTQPFEIIRSLYTEDAYAAIVQKELGSSYFAGIRYEMTSTDGRGTIYLWPVPSSDTTSLVLYRPMQLRELTSLTDQYDFPPGAVPALTYELAKWLALRYQRPMAGLDTMADKALAVYQRGNAVMVDLGMDAALTAQAGVYDILSDGISGMRG